ncbi:MAG: hypothetical protein GX770_04680, partial [Firmicutes bacterium]|nr:hypothetical protein [Bacillota bacterium]
KRLTSQEISAHLARVVQAEGLTAEEDALRLIGRETDGGMRDAIGLLEQGLAYAEGKLTAADVRAVLGLVENETLLALGEAAAAPDPVAGFRLIQKASDEGKDLPLFARQLAGFFRDLLLLLWAETADEVHLNPAEKEAARAIAEKLGVANLKRGVALFLEAGSATRRGTEGSLPLEMAFLRLLTEEEEAKASAPDRLIQKVAALERRLAQLEAAFENPSSTPRGPAAKAAPTPAVQKAPAGANPPASTPAATPPSAPATAEPAQASTKLQPFDHWEEVLAGVKQRKRTVEALLREGTPVGRRGNQLLIRFTLEFHWEKIREAEYARLVTEVLQEVTGEKLIPHFILGEAGNNRAEENSSDLLRKTLELFGGEVTEIKEEDR